MVQRQRRARSSAVSCAAALRHQRRLPGRGAACRQELVSRLRAGCLSAVVSPQHRGASGRRSGSGRRRATAAAAVQPWMAPQRLPARLLLRDSGFCREGCPAAPGGLRRRRPKRGQRPGGRTGAAGAWTLYQAVCKLIQLQRTRQAALPSLARIRPSLHGLLAPLLHCPALPTHPRCSAALQGGEKRRACCSDRFRLSLRLQPVGMTDQGAPAGPEAPPREQDGAAGPAPPPQAHTAAASAGSGGAEAATATGTLQATPTIGTQPHCARPVSPSEAALNKRTPASARRPRGVGGAAAALAQEAASRRRRRLRSRRAAASHPCRRQLRGPAGAHPPAV